MDYKIPDRLTFKRNEVTRLLKLDGRVIDFWAKEYGNIEPIVNKMGEVFYTRQDLDFIIKIKQLLTVELKSKDEIKKIIAKDKKKSPKEVDCQRVEAGSNHSDTLKILKKGLKEILTILEKDSRI